MTRIQAVEDILLLRDIALILSQRLSGSAC